MFSFFKRGKREPEKLPHNKNRSDHKEECDENPSKFESALEDNKRTLPTQVSSLASAELHKNCAVSEVSSSNEKLNTKYCVDEQTNKKMSFKTPEPRQNVKPCGHGTLAIAPRAHFSSSKREQSNTPPTSPKFEVRKLKEKSGLTTEPNDLIEDNNNKLRKSEFDPAYTPLTSTRTHDNKEKNLINQEAKFQSELNDLTKQLTLRDAEANKLRFQMEELQRDVFAKSAGMDRLQTELQAANKESDMTRIRIRHLESDLAAFRENNARLTETLETKTDELEKAKTEAKSKIEELQEVIRQLKTKVNWLEQQIESLKEDKKALEREQEKLKTLKLEDEKQAKEALQQAMRQKTELEEKWKISFEKLRSVNIMKEQDLLDDFEWKLREVQQNCKKRLEEKDKAMEKRLQDAYENSEKKIREAESIMEQISSLKQYETEVLKLRGLTQEQAQALQEMKLKQEQMRAAEASLKKETQSLRKLIVMEKENIQHIQRIHQQELLDKERNLQHTLDDKRLEIAMYWEEKLLHEIGRLKDELEQIYLEEKQEAIERIKNDKETEFQLAKSEWDKRMKECSNEIAFLKRTLDEKESYYQEENERRQTKTDQDILDLRRLMDKIDMTHHERFEQMVLEHERELENINKETEQRIKEVEFGWQQQLTNLRKSLDMTKEQMEQESQQKIAMLIEKHRSELDKQWDNLIKQKEEAVVLVENDYILKYKDLENNMSVQQLSHEKREIELLKIIDCLKNDLESKNSTIIDLQSTIDTLEGGIQVLNQEIAKQCGDLSRTGQEADTKIKSLQDTIHTLQKERELEQTAFEEKLSSSQKKYQETIDHLQRRCNCLTKLFEEVRLRYERRESRQEDLNIIADLRQVIGEQEKDLACVNEEKRYFQMRLIALEKTLNGANPEDEVYQDAEEEDAQDRLPDSMHEVDDASRNNARLPSYPMMPTSINGLPLSIPPTIQECDDYDE